MSAKPPPPAPPLVELQRRGPLLRALLWVTEPSLLKGIALGITLSLVVTVGAKLDAVWYAVSALLLIACALILGVMIGHFVLEGRKRRLQRGAATLLGDAGAALPRVGDTLIDFARSRDPAELRRLWSDLAPIRGPIRELVGLFVAMIFRVMAMSTLIAVLGGAISFAVFLATYLQVERMGEQNQLLRRQNEMIDDQTALIDQQLTADRQAREVDLSLSTASQRQAIVLGLIEAIDAEIALLKGDAVARGEGLGSVRPGVLSRITLSTGMYRRIQRTLGQLEPYRIVDPGTMRVGATRRSPEQQLLLHYLEGSAIDLSRVHLRRAHLVGADLRELELGGIDLSGSSFDGATMAEVDLSDAYLEESSLQGIDGGRGIFAGAHMTRANLDGADLRGADLSGADLGGASLVGADLRRAILEGADLGGADLRGVVLAEANLGGRIKLAGTELAWADLRGIDRPPSEAALRQAKGWERALYPEALASSLGLDAAAQEANERAFDRLRAATSAEARRTILGELTGAADQSSDSAAAP